MNCPNCNHPLTPDSKFCGACGAPVPQSDFADDKTKAADEFATRVFEPQQDKTVAADEFAARAFEPQEDKTQIADEFPAPSQGFYAPKNEFSTQTAEIPPQDYDDPFRRDASTYQQPDDPAEPVQPRYDHGTQFRQPSPQAGAPGPKSGSQPPKKNNKTALIVIIAVVSVLLIGGGVFLAIWLVNSNSGENSGGKTSSALSLQSSEYSSSLVSNDLYSSSEIEQSSEEESVTSYFSSEDESSSQSSEESSYIESSRESSEESSEYSSQDESSDLSSAPVSSSGGRQNITNDSGVEIANDPSINADDHEAEQKLNDYISGSYADSLIEAMSNDEYSGKIYAKGNALVYEMTMLSDIPEAQKEQLKITASLLETSMSGYVEQSRKESGVDNMVMVYAYLDADGSPITSAVCK